MNKSILQTTLRILGLFFLVVISGCSSNVDMNGTTAINRATATSIPDGKIVLENSVKNALKNQKELRRHFSDGGLVIIQGAKESDLETLLDVSLPARLAADVQKDQEKETPLQAKAIGIMAKPNGGYHLVHYMGEVSLSHVQEDYSSIRDYALGVGDINITSLVKKTEQSSVSPLLQTTPPCPECLSGQVLYDYKPIGKINSAWSLLRTDIADHEHVWIVKVMNDIIPGEALKSLGYDPYATDFHKPRIYVNYPGEGIRDADPQTGSKDGIFQVILGSFDHNASWSWTAPGVKVNEICDFESDCSWNFQYDDLSNSRKISTKQQPGIVATNQFGRFYVNVSHDTKWTLLQELSAIHHKSQDSYTISVSDW